MCINAKRNRSAARPWPVIPHANFLVGLVFPVNRTGSGAFGFQAHLPVPGHIIFPTAMKLHRTICFNILLLALAVSAQSQRSKGDAASPDKLYQDALAADARGDVPQAVQLYEKLLELRPDFLPARANLGAALARAGRYQDAVAQYQTALKTGPKNPVIQLNLALAWYKQAEFEKAMAVLEELRKDHSDNRQSLYLLGDCYLRLAKFRDAIALLQPIYDQGPDDRTVDYVLGMALIRDGQVQKGEIVIDRVLKSGNSAEVQLLMGAAQFSAGDDKKAAATLRAALDADPKLPGAWTLYGRTLLRTGDTENAKTAFLKALEVDPNDFEADLYLGGTLRHDGNYEQALPHIENALRLRPGSAEARFQSGMLNLALGHLQEALADLEHIERDWPDFQQVHVELATLYSRLGRKADSQRERQIVLDLNQKARDQGPQPDR